MRDIDIETFTGLEIKLDFDKPLKEQAEECKNEIVKNCNERGWKNYVKGWTVTRKGKSGESWYVVWNKTDYFLTHLLEKGHIIANKKGGVGYAAPHPHIKPAFDKIKKNFSKKIINDMIIEIKQKG